jgi:carboxyl-terminal processing protease
MYDNMDYQHLIQEIKEYRENRERNRLSLNLEQRRKEKEESEQRKFERENELRKAKGLKLLEKGEVVSNENGENDFLLKESSAILADLILQKIG